MSHSTGDFCGFRENASFILDLWVDQPVLLFTAKQIRNMSGLYKNKNSYFVEIHVSKGTFLRKARILARIWPFFFLRIPCQDFPVFSSQRIIYAPVEVTYVTSLHYMLLYVNQR